MDLYNEIAKVAYDIFEREGHVHGRHLEHWIEAEIIVTTKYEEMNKDRQNDTKASKPKKKTATRTVVKKSKTKPKTAVKTTSRSKAKKTS